MSPSKLMYHDELTSLNLSYKSSSPLSTSSGVDDDGRSSNNSPSNLNINMFSLGYGETHACSQCTASFLTRDLLEKHELMHISNATVVSSFSLLHVTFIYFFYFISKRRQYRDRDIPSILFLASTLFSPACTSNIYIFHSNSAGFFFFSFRFFCCALE